MSYSKEDLIRYRFERAYQSLAEAEALANLKFWNTVANRLYYASYYALLGVFVSYGFEAHTHVGIKSIFNQHFVKTALVSMEMGKLHSNLFNKRQEGDYQDFQVFTEETIRPLMLPTRQLIEHLQTLVK